MEDINNDNAQRAIMGGGCFILVIAFLVALVALLCAIADTIGL